ncbi:MAG TPA: GtrA family protein [Vicinamibacterales bacterium]|jgi:putative flippase GtrA
MVRRFVIVGALGFVVQLVVFGALSRLGMSWFAATVVAVESAIVHNFVWHRSWTWQDRVNRDDTAAWLVSFLKFNAGTAVTSIAGNVGVMAIILATTPLEPIIANVIAVAVMSAANFLLADRWVFDGKPAACGMVAAVAVLLTPVIASAGPGTGTLAAWDKYVFETEARIDRDRPAPPRGSASVTADGRSIDVGSGTITHWHGSVFIPAVSVDQLLDRLKNPGTPPPQQDVVASRVISKTDDSLNVYMRLVRHAVVTVSYDTEHAMAFHRWSPTLATARSVATRIDEVGGDDHGFLWRLNSYWRYEEAGAGVLVSLESLTLSRDVPWLIKPVAGPISSSIARESIVRTLEALKKYVSRG